MINRITPPLLLIFTCLLTSGCGIQILYAGFSDKPGGTEFDSPYSPPGTPTGDKIVREGSFSPATVVLVDQSNGGIFGTSLRLNSAAATGTNRTLSFESAPVGTPGKRYSFAWDGIKTGGNVALDCHFGDETGQPLGLRFFNGQVMIPGGTVFGSMVFHTRYLSHLGRVQIHTDIQFRHKVFHRPSSARQYPHRSPTHRTK